MSHFEGRQINAVEVDRERAPLITRAFQLYATGEYSTDELRRILTAQGLTTRPTARRPSETLSVDKVRQILGSPYYAGMVTYQGETFAGRHTALIDAATFERVQEVIQLRSKPGQRDRVLFHYLKGLMFCDRCHKAGRISRLIYTEAKGRGGRMYDYYICRGRQQKVCDLPHIRASRVEAAITEYYAVLKIDPGLAREMHTKLDELLADEQQATRLAHANLQKQLAKIDAQEVRLLDLAADDLMPQDKIRAKLSKLKFERSEISSQLAQEAHQLAIGVEVVKLALTFLDAPQALYERATDQARRRLNSALFEAIFIDEHGDVATDTRRPPFDQLDAVGQEIRRRDAHEGQAKGSENVNGPYDEVARAAKTKPGPEEDRVSSKTYLVVLKGALSKGRFEALIALMADLRPLLNSEHAGQDGYVAPNPPALARRLTDAERFEVVARYRAGADMRSIARELRMHRTTVAQVLQAASVPTRQRGLSPAQLAEAVELYDDGWSLARLGERYGVNAETVRASLKRSGIIIRPRRGWTYDQ